MNNHIITVDPGISGTGIALWTEKDWYEQCVLSDKRKFFIRPRLYSSISASTPDKYAMILKKISTAYNVSRAYIEDAAAMRGSKGNMVSSSGRLVILAEYIGRLQQIFHVEGIYCELVSVQRWKGNLPKDIIKRRILKLWPECCAKDHDWDAIGIGYYLMGCINQ